MKVSVKAVLIFIAKLESLAMQDQAATSPYEVKISAQDVLCSSHYMNSVVLPNNRVTYTNCMFRF